MSSIALHVDDVYISGEPLNPTAYFFQKRAELESKVDCVFTIFLNLFACLRSQPFVMNCHQTLLEPEKARNKTVSKLSSRAQVVERGMKLLDRFVHVEGSLGNAFQLLRRLALLQCIQEVSGPTAIGGYERLQCARDYLCLQRLICGFGLAVTSTLPSRHPDCGDDRGDAANSLHPGSLLRCSEPTPAHPVAVHAIPPVRWGKA